MAHLRHWRPLVCCFLAQSISWASSNEPKTPKQTDYQGMDLNHQYQKDRSFKGLNDSFTAICDGILATSAKNQKLTPKEDRLISNFVHQNELFKQNGFDQAWLAKTRVNFNLLAKNENNRIAPSLMIKIEALFKEQNP